MRVLGPPTGHGTRPGANGRSGPAGGEFLAARYERNDGPPNACVFRVLESPSAACTEAPVGWRPLTVVPPRADKEVWERAARNARRRANEDYHE